MTTGASDMTPRWVTAGVGLPLFAATLWAGGAWWTGLVLFLIVLGLWEWWGLMTGRARRLGMAPPGPLAVLPGLVILLAAWGPLVLLRQGADGLAWTVLTVGGAWATDTAAFFVGRRVGGRPLAPRLSPRKTVAGSIGGLVGGALFVGLAASAWLGLRVPLAFGLGAFIGALAQAGDLLESGLKRWAGVKDSGRLLPGHGGVLDRFDSLALVAPVMWAARLLLSP